MVQLLIVSMDQAAPCNLLEDLRQAERKIRAYYIAVDNIGVFLGEDIFIAINSILFWNKNGYINKALHFAVWAILPPFSLLFIAHSYRIAFYQRMLIQRYTAQNKT